MRTRTNSALSTLLGRGGTVLVEVSASWCPPCRMLKPVVDLVARERSTTLRVAEVDADGDAHLVDSLGVAVLPTLILYRDGVEVRRATGFRGAADLAHFIDR
jgi:thioredoxin 1